MKGDVRMNLQKLAQRLADKQAIDTILSQCGAVVIQGKVWRDTSRTLSDTAVHWEVKYLSMRGLLRHHRLRYELVALRGTPCQNG